MTPTHPVPARDRRVLHRFTFAMENEAYASIEIPASISPEEWPDFEEWFALVLRRARRNIRPVSEDTPPAAPARTEE